MTCERCGGDLELSFTEEPMNHTYEDCYRYTVRKLTNLEEAHLKLRKLLWIRHGHLGLYGDDGEMQCSICRIDFTRDPVSEIIANFERQGREALRLTLTALET